MEEGQAVLQPFWKREAGIGPSGVQYMEASTACPPTHAPTLATDHPHPHAHAVLHPFPARLPPLGTRPRRADPPPAQSLALPFPGAEYAPYDAPSYVWNPAGSGLSRRYFGIPVYKMTQALSDDTVWRAQYNADQDLKGGRHVAEMVLPMFAKVRKGGGACMCVCVCLHACQLACVRVCAWFTLLP